MSTGLHKEFGTKIVFITDDFEKGSAYVNKHNETYQSAKKKMDSFFANEYKNWPKENPSGNEHLENVLQEMKEEEDFYEIEPEVREKYQKIKEEQEKNTQNWAIKFKEFIDQWYSNNLTKEEYELKDLTEPHWEIEEVQWLK